MTQYDNTNRGSLFKNDRKESDNHPDYKGQINIDGTDYWLSAWIKTDKNGNKYMSLSPQPKEQQGQKPQQRQHPAKSGGDPFDGGDNIPFAPYMRGFVGHAI